MFDVQPSNLVVWLDKRTRRVKRARMIDSAMVRFNHDEHPNEQWDSPAFQARLKNDWRTFRRHMKKNKREREHNKK